MTKRTKEQVIDAIKGTGPYSQPGKITSSMGIISQIAARLNVSRKTVYTYAQKWTEVDEAIKEERENMDDHVRSKMFEKIMAGDTSMIIFYAKTRMGYSERKDIFNVDVDLSQMTEAQLARVASGESPVSVLLNPE